MRITKLTVAMHLATVFLERSRELIKQGSEKGLLKDGRYSASVKRASLDLTRSLANLRKPDFVWDAELKKNVENPD